MKTPFCTLLCFLLTVSAVWAQNVDQKRPPHRSKPKTVAEMKWSDVARKMPAEWYGTAEALALADTVIAYQFPSGGWAKNNQWNKVQNRASLRKAMQTTGIGSTIDNKATTIEMLYLAKVYNATGAERCKEAFIRGVNYLLEMQYDNGGWPQYYPLKVNSKGRPDYSSHITFNDGAMANVMKVLRDIARNKQPYHKLNLSEDLIRRSQEAFDKGIDCILKTQVRIDGKRTVWCQQYDEKTLQPANARAYEHASLTGCGETPDLLLLLMGFTEVSEEYVEAVTAGIEWLKAHAIHDKAIERFTDEQGRRDYRLVDKPGARPLWARYYDLETQQPYFCGRDGIKRARVEEIEYERRTGYSWLSGDAQEAIDEYDEWIGKVRAKMRAKQQKKSVAQNLQKGDYGYLYCHMSDRGEWTAYALSRDGLHFHDLIHGDPIFDPAEHARIEGGTRDAYICRKHDGSGYLMVTTDMCVRKSKVWDNYGIDLYTSDDLIHWSSVTFDFRKGDSIFSDPDSPDAYENWSTINRVWAPQIVWDPAYVWPDGKKGGYFIYYSLWNRAEEPYDRMYYSYADESFTTLTKPRLLFDWGYATIDSDINYLESDGLYHMMIKKEGGTPGLFTATSKAITGPWSEPVADDYVDFEGKKKCEGVSAFQLFGEEGWRIAYIEYSSRPRNYRICKADKYMRNFSNPQNIEGVNGPQHGSFMRLTREEYERLQAWSDEREARHIQPNVNNPVIPGLYADPEILYSEKDKRYYLYPTTDGIVGWKNHDFHLYSSADLKEWKDEGVMIDLKKDISWADECGWAPCAIERKYGRNNYRYYYYFVADKKIGVAVAKHPAGPYRDALGKPLLDKAPAGSGGGQVIDPDVFRDPVSGKYYLYWGNSYLAVAELGDDMISLRGEPKILIPRKDKRKYGYNEATYVFYRDGKYYFMWSENDTRSANYRVRYLISDSPTEFVRDGKPVGVERTVVLSQDPSKGIYGTGHHSILQKPGTDEWYIVYHRFARPDAIKKGWDAGYNREICIDKLEFNPDGTIRPVVPTL